MKFTKKLHTQLLETKIFKHIIGSQLEILTKSTRGFNQPYFQCTNSVNINSMLSWCFCIAYYEAKYRYYTYKRVTPNEIKRTKKWQHNTWGMGGEKRWSDLFFIQNQTFKCTFQQTKTSIDLSFWKTRTISVLKLLLKFLFKLFLRTIKKIVYLCLSCAYLQWDAKVPICKILQLAQIPRESCGQPHDGESSLSFNETIFDTCLLLWLQRITSI